MTEQEQKIEMVNLARSLFERGYTVGGAGNLSVRLDENRILVTPTGSSLGRLEADRLSVLDMQGNVLSGDKPSKESVFHLAMYQKNPACQAIVHLHSTYLTALSCLENLDTDNAMRAFTLLCDAGRKIAGHSLLPSGRHQHCPRAGGTSLRRQSLFTGKSRGGSHRFRLA